MISIAISFTTSVYHAAEMATKLVTGFMVIVALRSVLSLVVRNENEPCYRVEFDKGVKEVV